MKAVLFPCAGVTLREGDREYFYAALDRGFPGLRQKYTEKYGLSYELLSDSNDRLLALCENLCDSLGLAWYSGFEKFFDFIKFLPSSSGGQLSFF